MSSNVNMEHLKIPLYFEINPNGIPYINGFSKDISKEFLLERDDRRFDLGNYPTLFEYVFKEVNYIPDSQSFYYPILVSLWRIAHFIDKIEIPQDILNSIREKRCKILLICPYEGWGFYNFWVKLIDVIKFKYSFSNIDFVICDGDYLRNHDVSHVTYNFWEEMYLDEFIKNGLESIFNIRKYKFICLNRRPSPHRYAMVTELIDLKDQGIITLASYGSYGEQIIFSSKNDFFLEWPHHTDKFCNLVEPNIPLKYDDGYNPEIDNPNYDNKTEKFHQSYLHIITETHYSNNCIFLSEKIFKPIVHCQPFIVFGNPGTLKVLKELGYQTFEKYIDESYDNELDIHKRLQIINFSIREFISKTPEELTKIMIEMKSIFEHNISTLQRRQFLDIKLNILADLRRELHKK